MNYIRTERGLTLFTPDGQTLSLHQDDKRWDKAIELLKAGDEDALTRWLNPAKTLNDYVSPSGALKVEAGVLRYKGHEIPGDMHVVRRALQLQTEGFPVEPLLNFVERLMNNPSSRAVRELLQFLEYGELPLTPVGCFLAYKKVAEGYLDCHSHTINNAVGQVVEMPRNMVDDRSENTCSHGLHFCSREYLVGFHGAHTMVLKIDPADVVSIPTDYNNTKGRCCKYTVVGELPHEPEQKNHWGAGVVNQYEPRGFAVGDHVIVREGADCSSDLYGLVGVVERDDGEAGEGVGRFLVAFGAAYMYDSAWLDAADLIPHDAPVAADEDDGDHD